MNHDFIAANDVIARYVADRLPGDDERAFEAHLIDCALCTGEVEQELALRAGLGAVAAEHTTAPQSKVSIQSWRSSPWLQAAAVLFAAIALGLAVSLARTTSDLNTAQNEIQAQQRRADEAARTSQGLERRIADLEARASEPSPERVGAPPAKVLPTVVLALTAVRGGTDAIDTFVLDRRQPSPLVVLTVDVPPGEYSVTLRDRDGIGLWSGGPFRPSSQDVMAVAVERGVMIDGRYTLEVHRGPSAQTTPVARFPFQISSR